MIMKDDNSHGSVIKPQVVLACLNNVVAISNPTWWFLSCYSVMVQVMRSPNAAKRWFRLIFLWWLHAEVWHGWEMHLVL